MYAESDDHEEADGGPITNGESWTIPARRKTAPLRGAPSMERRDMSFNSGNNGDSNRRDSGSTPGNTIGAGIAIGAALGVALGLAFRNLALGIAIGAGIGVALGAAMEQNREGKAAQMVGSGTRPLWALVVAGLTLLAGVVVVILMVLR